MSHLYVSATGTNWMDLDDDDLEIFAPDKNEPDECDEPDERDGYDNADDAATCAVENGQEDISNAADDYYEDTPVSLNVANLKYLNEVWHICRALPAYKEFSFDKYWYYPHVRVQYKSNWIEFKQCMGGDVSIPMLMKCSPLRLCLTREYDEKGGFIIHEDGTLIDGPLFAHAEFKPLQDNSEPEKQAEESQMPLRSPPCVPGMRKDDEINEYESETEVPSACQEEGVYAYGPPTQFVCESESGIIHDDEPSDEDEAGEHARSTAGEDTGSSAESSSGQSNGDASPSTSVSSAFSESSEDGVPESDVATASESEVDDCVTLDTTPTNIQESVVLTDKLEVATQPIATAVEGSHTTPMCLDTVSSTEINDDTSTTAVDHESVLEGLESDDDTEETTITFSSPAKEAPVVTSSSIEPLLTSGSGDDIAGPVPVTVEDDNPSSTHLSTAEVKFVDYTTPADCTEDISTGYVDSSTTLIEDAGVAPDLVFSQPPPTTPLVWDVVCTAGFALSSLPWLRMGVAAAGIVVDVAATLLRR